MTLNLSEPYEFKAGQPGLRTRDGREARIYCVRDKGEEPIHGAICNKDTGVWRGNAWRLDGRWWDGGDTTADLMPPKREVYVAVWLTPNKVTAYTMVFDNAQDAEDHMNNDFYTRLAVLGPVDREPKS